jgi:BlaI family penicillinase repressor
MTSKNKIPDISQAEWKIMKLLWSNSPQPAYDLAEALSKTEKWHPNTVKTMLSRLHRKKAVGVKRYKNLYHYSALVTEAECMRVESDSFLDRFFSGSLKPMLVHFAETRKLSPSEIEELKRLLKRSEGK